jgi:putative oxidoreductase
MKIEALNTGLLPFAARVLICAIFVQGALGKITGWSGQAEYMASHGMRFIPPLLGAALVIEVGGVLALLTGYQARPAALVMFVYLGIVSVMLHNFWALSGMSAGANQTAFLKNVGIMGGLLLIAAYGPGSWALGAQRSKP